MTDPAASILSEPLIGSLDTLFSTDPLDLSDVQVDQIVTALRTQRAEYVASGGKGRAKKIDLSDLDIQL